MYRKPKVHIIKEHVIGEINHLNLEVISGTNMIALIHVILFNDIYLRIECLSTKWDAMP